MNKAVEKFRLQAENQNSPSGYSMDLESWQGARG
jgi:hypothetical protein